MSDTETQGGITIRRADERGRADFGWLKSRHSFSFGQYHDPRHSGFRTLSVINEDRVIPGGGFETHPHRDVEIFSYVLKGRMKHQDSMGNGRTLEPGQIQLMSAGSGLTHSEFNPSDIEGLHFLQIWIEPRERGLPPGYTEWHPTPDHEEQAKVLVISADGRENSARIQQDAEVYRVRLNAGEAVSHELGAGRGLWLQVMRGEVELNGTALGVGDGAGTEKPGDFEIHATSDTEALLFDLG